MSTHLRTSRPVPILFTIPNFITAGSGRAMLNIIERLDRAKFSPAVCVMRKGGNLDREVERLGIPLLEAPFAVPATPYHTLLARAWKVARVFRQYRFALWHSFHYSDDYTEPIIARLAGVKAWIYTKKNMGWGSRAWRLRSFLANRIVAQNTTMIEQFFSGQEEKVTLIPRGVDVERFRPGVADPRVRRNLDGDGTATIVAHVAHFVPVKNHPYLIQALACTQDDISLVLAGDYLDDSYAAEVRSLVDQLNLRQRVRFLGNVKNIPELLRSIDIFAFCSQREACPVAVLEAMACGLPCVVTDIPAMRDIHQPGETALVVPQGDVKAFASALDNLARDAERRRQLGEAARKQIERAFSVEREAAQHEQLYREVVAKARQNHRIN